MKYRRDIDGLRTVAVVPVVVFHAGLGLSGGYVGVDIFFVISGYLITFLLLRDMDQGRYSLLEFYERRMRRIFPALFFMLAVVTVVAAILFVPSDLRSYGASAVAAALFAANIFFWTQEGYFTEAAELKPLLHTWSLGVEEQYYIFFPPLLYLLHRTFGVRGLLGGLVALTMLSFVVSLQAVRAAPNAAYYLPHNRIWELLCGSLLAIATLRGLLTPLAARPGVLAGASVAGLVLIALPVLLYSSETPFPGLAALPPCLGAVLLIATGGLRETPVSRILSTAPMVFIGKLSYSFYLWHWPVIAFTYYVFGEVTPLAGLACIAASFVLAYLSWRFVEAPFRDAAAIGRRAIFGGSTAALMMSVGVGGALYVADGLPDRMPAETRAYMDPDNFLHDRRECHFVTPERAAAGDLCIRGAVAAPPRFIFAGDSHADAFSPAIFAAAEAAALAGYQYTNAGFRPLPGVTKRGEPDWETQVEAFVDFVRAQPTIEVVILKAYWQHQMTGYTYRHAGDMWVDEAYDGSGTDYNSTATLNGLARLAEALPNVQIVLLDDVPTGTALHIRDQIRGVRFGRSEMVGLPRTEAEAQRALYEPQFKSLADQIGNIAYVPVFEAACGPQVCPLFEDDKLLFRDGDHLSFEGALALQDPAAALLKTIGLVP